MPDDAKEPHPPPASRVTSEIGRAMAEDWKRVQDQLDAAYEGPQAPPLPRIALVDGDTTTPLSAEALAVALFASVPDQFKAGVLAAAVAVQGQLDKGQRVQIQTSRVVRPGNGVGL